MNQLKQILTNIKILDFQGETSIEIKGVTADSRKVENGFLFVAINGSLTNGHNFIEKAIKKGAVAIIYTEEIEISENISFIKVDETQKSLAIAAANFYDNPSEKLKIIGVTGTNGKTTIATTLYNLFSGLGYKTGLISTISNYIINEEIKATHTTPDSTELQKLFSEMVEKECEYCFMEVSSHALDQKRVFGVDFDGAIFTNITHDHLDYHVDFKNYLDVKKSLFDNLKPEAFALTNIDDKNGKVIIQNSKNNYTYSLKTLADFKAKIIEKHFDSTLVSFNNQEIWLQFVGAYNVYNLLAIYATATLLLENKNEEILSQLSLLKPVNGRFDVIKGNGIFTIVDYAHTPDALENILKELKDIKNENQNLITVIGAGGDRDKTKRPKMAAIADFYSDMLILTSDNPRTENPETILEEMEKGLDENSEYLKISDRRQAIKTAVKFAKPKDIILIAGKGHETYQEINGIRHHFDDKEEITKQFTINNAQ
ncbi:MAG: UDP-N-acetylmuramoyl-L-alanyl-D-glutamate--2,6-diaminopimelate ligase [Bacteroidales bacterium]|nr:UDP-N-acetylmuramoyl-L-alanyl-D-glutamate--2,6-diaminopimelate ligase [Bacteroidales bacterium]